MKYKCRYLIQISFATQSYTTIQIFCVCERKKKMPCTLPSLQPTRHPLGGSVIALVVCAETRYYEILLLARQFIYVRWPPLVIPLTPFHLAAYPVVCKWALYANKYIFSFYVCFRRGARRDENENISNRKYSCLE